jgi:predicted small lipoprotein YifL
MPRRFVAASLLLGAGLLAGCGQKGPLFLPPARSVTPPPASSAQPTAPATSASAPDASAALPEAASSG